MEHGLTRFIPAWIQIIFIYFPLNISLYFHVSFPRYMYQRNSYVTSTRHRFMFKCLWYHGFKSSSITKRCSYSMPCSWIIFNLMWKESYLSYTTFITFHFCFSPCVFSGISPPTEERLTPELTEDAASTGPLRSHPHRHAMMKRLTRTDNRRYHTAGAIDDLKVCTHTHTHTHTQLHIH